MDLSYSKLFEKQGFVGGIPVFTEADCRKVLQTLSNRSQVQDRGFFLEKNSLKFNDMILAQFPSILRQATALFGENLLLWGGSIIERIPGQIHPWHSDIETCDSTVRSISVWIGLDGITKKSSLQVISFSHQFEKSLQEIRSLHGIARDELTSNRVLDLSQKRNPQSQICSPCQRIGEAIFFDGRIWHGSHNLESKTVRTALLLQFISTDSVIRVPDPDVLDWPFQYLDDYQTKVYLANGTDTFLRNNLMKSPARKGLEGLPALETSVHSIPLPIPENPETGWNPHGISRGPSSQLNDLACHASVLSPGCTPHPPHKHPEDEILLVLGGEIEIQLVNDGEDQWEKLQRGEFSYYPADQLHTLHNKSSEPVYYVMFKWYSEVPCDSVEYLKTAIIRHESQSVAEKDFHPEIVLEGSTRSLKKFHSHYSTLQPSGGYPAHADSYDVMIVTLKGKIETLGKEVGPNSVIFYAAGEPHGMKNIGEETAEYLVFEFHGVHSLDFQEAEECTTVLPNVDKPISPVLPLNRKLLRPIERFAKKLVGISPKA